MSSATVLLWLGAYALHSTLLLAGVWTFERLNRSASPALLGALWRTALVAGVLTATLQTSGFVEPLAGRMAVVASAPEVTAPAAAPPEALPPVIESPIAQSNAEVRAADGPQSVVRQPFELPRLPAWPVLLVGLWAIGALALALRGGLIWFRAHRELSHRTPVWSGPLYLRLCVLARDAGFRRLPRASLSDRIAGPFTLPSGEICIPAWASERLPDHQFEAMLAHEMAHAVNRDSLWLTIGMAMSALCWFQPLNLVARTRLAHLAELSADDWAATRSGGGRPLAECLSEFAGMAQGRPAPAFAAAMAASKSSLVQRVERLLGGGYSKGILPVKIRVLIAAGAVALSVVLPGVAAHAGGRDRPARPAAPAVPAIPSIPALPARPPRPAAPPRPPEPSASQESDIYWSPGVRRSMSVSDRSISVTSTSPGRHLEVKSQGATKLAPDGSGVISIESGGFLDATLKQGAVERRVRYTNEGGRVMRQFWQGGRGQTWNADADRFVAELMPILFRETGLSANERVDWLLANRGPDGLLNEIELIDADSVSQRYVTRFAETKTIAAPQFARLAALIGRNMDSNSALSATLETLFVTQKPAAPQLVQLLQAAHSLDSDSATHHLLSVVADAAMASDVTTGAFIDVAEGIDSDSALGATLEPLVGSRTLSDARIVQLITLGGRQIDSDSMLSRVLVTAAPRVGASDVLARAYTDASRQIDSDSARGQALRALAGQARLTASGWKMLLDATAGIDSDSEKAAVLADAASRMPRQNDLVAAYQVAARTIDSDSAWRRTQEALN